MIRLVNMMALGLAVTASFGLYQMKYKTQQALQEVRQLERQIERERETVRVLQAEWSHLTRADRLQALADKYLDLAPVTPGQVVSIRDIPLRPLDIGRQEPNLFPGVVTGPAARDRSAPPVSPRPKPLILTRGGKTNG